VKLVAGEQIVCASCQRADSFGSRLKGLLGRKSLATGEGLLLEPLSSVHTWFMRFPIDVVFLDREMTVVKVIPTLGPWRFAAARHAHYALELRAGAAEGLRVGTRLEVR
jgi:uncharacterized membrane protein (UPF0127 family)